MTQRSLWSDRAFVLFWFGRAVSLVGSAVTLVVLPILVYQLTGSALQTALLSTLNVAPYLVFGLLAGAIADRVDRRRLMVACDLLNALLLGSIPLANWLGMLTLPQIYVVALCSASVFVWFDAANFGALPTLVGRERLIVATSMIWTASTLIAIIGPALGGLLAAQIGAAQSIGLNAISYTVSAVLLAIIPRSLGGAEALAAGPGAEAGLADTIRSISANIREGLTFIWHQPLVRTMTLLGFGNSLFGGALMGLLVVYAVQALGLSQQDPQIGTLYAAGAVGGLATSLVLPWLIRRVSPGWITLASLLISVPLMIGLAIAPTFRIGVVLYLAWDGANTLVIINGITLRQLVTPDHLQSRVNTSARMIAWGGTPFGGILGGILAEYLGVRETYLILAAGMFMCVLFGWFSPLRHQQPAEVQQERS